MLDTVNRLFVCGLVCLLAGGAFAQGTGFNWSEQTNLAYDSGDTLLGTGALAWVYWDADASGLGDWSPCNPVLAGDTLLTDINSSSLEFAFSDFMPGNIVGNWTVNDPESWQADGEELYLLVWVPDTISASGLEEWGVSSLVTVTGWPNNAIEHNIEGGGPIHTAPCAIPEPGTLLLVAAGFGLFLLRRKK
jgi:hypothetical protein